MKTHKHFFLFCIHKALLINCLTTSDSDTYARVTSVRLSHNDDVTTVTSRIECCKTCTKTADCVLVSYNQMSQTCELSTKGPDGLIHMDAQTGWNVYYNIEDDCSRNPCQNMGTCTDAIGYYRCDCTTGWEGTDCEIEVDKCAGGPCLNGGNCTDGLGYYTCKCASGWDGPDCQKRICPEEWNVFEASCYYISTIPMTWETAQNTCVKHGGHLADITTENVNTLVIEMYKSLWGLDVDHRFWIGGNDKDIEGEFVLSDGTPLSSGFEYWNIKQPDNSRGLEHCINVLPHKSFKWNDAKCQIPFEFICKY